MLKRQAPSDRLKFLETEQIDNHLPVNCSRQNRTNQRSHQMDPKRVLPNGLWVLEVAFKAKTNRNRVIYSIVFLSPLPISTYRRSTHCGKLRRLLRGTRRNAIIRSLLKVSNNWTLLKPCCHNYVFENQFATLRPIAVRSKCAYFSCSIADVKEGLPEHLTTTHKNPDST